MQRQRQDLSMAVRQLTDNSNSLYHQLRKRSDTKCSWSETDLDLENLDKIKDISFASAYKSDQGISNDINNQNFSNLSLQDKQEIKTVRIVKREAERRQRDREKTDKSIQHLDDVLKEEFNVLQGFNQNRLRSQSRESDMFDTNTNISTNPFRTSESYTSDRLTYGDEDNSYFVTFNDNLTQKSTDKSSNMQVENEENSLVYRSEAAKQIITEMSSNVENSSNLQKRVVPKEKKRHNTVPHDLNLQFIEMLQSNNESNKNVRNKILLILKIV